LDRYADGRTVSPRRRQKVRILADAIASQFAGYTDLRAVDFGCADGAVPVLVLRSGTGQLIREFLGITLLDYNDLPDKPAFEHPRFTRMIGDLEGSLEDLDLPWSECDLVVATAFFHYLERPELAFDHAARLLRPGGALIAGMPHPLVLRVRRRGLGLWLAPNRRIRQIKHLEWWRALAWNCGFVEVDRRAVQWLGISQTAGTEQLLRRIGVLGTFGSNVLVVYRRREER